jgi:hypothetical protein
MVILIYLVYFNQISSTKDFAAIPFVKVMGEAGPNFFTLLCNLNIVYTGEHSRFKLKTPCQTFRKNLKPAPPLHILKWNSPYKLENLLPNDI